MSLWYTEEEAGRVRVGFAVNETLYKTQSEFQSIEVVDTVAYGRLLLLDGMVMITDRDEFVYHEMISHVPVCLHKDPRSAIVIGGGDGGTVRELLKHKSIERIVLCEIDGTVVETCRRFFPEVASGLDDPRVTVQIGDGVEFIKTVRNEADIVLVDSTDPVRHGEGLFSPTFYRDVATALAPDGIMVAQSESPWLPGEFIGRIFRNIGSAFTNIYPYVGSVPTYPRGFWSWTLASAKSIDTSAFDAGRFQDVAPTLKYLTAAGIPAAFAVPKFFSEKIAEQMRS